MEQSVSDKTGAFSNCPGHGLGEAGFCNLAVEQYSLTSLQLGMVAHSLAAPGGGEYVQQLVITLAEPLRVAAWQAAWDKLVARHAGLRTTFDLANWAVPMQQVHPSAAGTFIEHDWRGQPPETQARQFEQFLSADRRGGFDTGRLPLWRWNWFRCGDGDNRLVWSSHHALFDGRSRRILLLELFTLYDAIIQGKSIALASTTPFSEYLGWLASREEAPSLAYWKQLLRGFNRPTALPERKDEFPRPAGAALHRTISRRWSPARTADLQQFASENQVTLNTLLQGAWALVLGQEAGSEDVVFGATRAGRRAPVAGIADMIGLLINTVPVRVQLPATARVSEWLSALRGQWLAAREHEYVSLAKVQQGSELPVGQPLFESLVVFENFRLEEVLWRHNPAWRTRRVSLLGTTPYPLVVSGFLGEALTLELTFDQRRFDSLTVERMLGRLENVLQGMVAKPGGILHDLPGFSERGKNPPRYEWNCTTAKYPSDRCIHQLFEAQVERSPEAVAVVFEQQSQTYRELNQRANQLAHRLQALGVGPEVPVALCLERSLELVTAILAIVKAGGVYVPIDAEYPPGRKSFILDDSQAIVLLTQSSLAAAFSTTATVLCLDTDWTALDRESWENIPTRTIPENAAYIIFTSGSTGQPKGVVVTHRNLVCLLGAATSWYGFAPTDVWTMFHSCAFDFSVWEMWGALLYGGRLIVVPYLTSRTPSAFWELLQTEGVTILNQTPSAFSQLIRAEAAAAAGPDLRLRWVIFGGEALQLSMLQPWFERHGDLQPRIVNMYGITETTVVTTGRWITAQDVRAGVGSVIGQPLPDQEVYLLDEQLQPVSPNEPGEIFIGGTGVSRGYWNQPELTRERFIAHPFAPGQRLYRSGDLARRLSNGDLEYVGRADQQVKIRGFRIELGEVETVLNRQPDLAQAVVLACPASNGALELRAWVVARKGRKLQLAALRQDLKPWLPGYMIPSTFIVLEQLPINLNGKVDRPALAKIAAPRLTSEVDYVAPRTDLERQLAAIWQEVLGVPQIGLQDDFFELGGHSLLAMQAVIRTRQLLGVELLVADLFRHRTLAGVAAKVSAEAPLARSGPVPVARDRGAPLLGSQLAYWNIYQHYQQATQINVSRAYRLQGHLAVAALQQALTWFVRRHESLRTIFREVDGQPRQFVTPAETVPLPLVDLGLLAVDEQEAEVQRWYAADSIYCIDLGRGPMVRARLIRLNELEHILLFTVHHITMDGASLAIFHREFAESYAALREGRSPQWTDLPLQPFDYAAWQQVQLEAGNHQRSLAYWRQLLHPLWAAHGFPVFDPQRQPIDCRASRQTVDLPGQLHESLNQLAQSEGCSLANVLFAVLAILQHDMTGCRGIPLGVTFAARVRPEIQNLVGCFRNSTILYIKMEQAAHFRYVLREAKGIMMDAISHLEIAPEIAFRDRHFPHPRDWPGALFNYNYMSADSRGLQLPGLATTTLVRPQEVVNFPYELMVFEHDSHLQLLMKGRSDLFNQLQVKNTLERFIQLLERVTVMPDAPLSELISLGQGIP